ncbi:MAG: Lrp/AsnC family transcriptional regulator [Pseudomonadota bacterium]|nr:Lrp/AsnC family transcriptional regulator [Pseudomonadota bacterium]
MFSEWEKALARRLQDDIPLVGQPFQEIGAAEGRTEEEVRAFIDRLLLQGAMRRFGAVVRHREVGYTHNALVVWSVPAERVEEAGGYLAARREVTHCYERTPPFLGRYNLFSMVHRREEDLAALVGRLARDMKIEGYLILKSEEELKKTSKEYFA